jgi:predicted amidohydrolase
MSNLKVGLLQMSSSGPDEDANLEKGLRHCRMAKAAGADIALFPEMWSIGYTCPAYAPKREALRLCDRALDLDAPFLQAHQELAAELEMAIAVTFLQRWPGGPRDALALYDRRGKLVLVYAKVHTCDFDTEAWLTPGDAFSVCELDTAAGPVMVGAMICFDVLFPESARILMLGGAELILVPNACEVDEGRMACIRTRAYENMVAVALANYADPQEDGHSAAFDPIAYRPFGSDREGRFVDSTVIRAGRAEGVYVATFDLDLIRRFRQTETQGNAYRRPSVYGALIDPTVRPPFVRSDARR